MSDHRNRLYCSSKRRVKTRQVVEEGEDEDGKEEEEVSFASIHPHLIGNPILPLAN